MSMEHKAFLFDTKKYHENIEVILDTCCYQNNTEAAEIYINQHLCELSSPYTGDKLDNDWKETLFSGDIQEYADYLLTSCYDVNHNIGLDYAWDGLNEIIQKMHFMDESEICVLGKTVMFHGIIINPGAMGMGIISQTEVGKIRKKLLQNGGQLNTMSVPADLLYKMDMNELIQAYEDLCDIYTRAEQERKGILFTF